MAEGKFNTDNPRKFKMPFKINISNKGKTLKQEVESEVLIGKTIGEKISGIDVSEDLKDYELEITGTSDKAGFPGLPEQKGAGLRKVLLTYGRGMHKRPKGERKKADQPKGLRLRKTVRGNEISEDTIQINIKVLKEGAKKFDDFFKQEASSVEPGKEEKEKTE